MAFINPVLSDDIDLTDDLDAISKYIKSLGTLVNIISPINVGYDLGLNELDDNSFEDMGDSGLIFSQLLLDQQYFYQILL